MTECIFCKIINKEIPNYPVYEDNHALAFLDIYPHAKGHTVVIPKVHAELMSDLNEQLSQELMLAVKRTMERIETVLQPDGFNVGWNNGKAAGQVVPHLHVHIFPRWENDGGESMHAVISNPGEKTVEELAQLFAKK